MPYYVRITSRLVSRDVPLLTVQTRATTGNCLPPSLFSTHHHSHPIPPSLLIGASQGESLGVFHVAASAFAAENDRPSPLCRYLESPGRRLHRSGCGPPNVCDRNASYDHLLRAPRHSKNAGISVTPPQHPYQV